MEISMYGTESYVTFVRRERIEIDTDNYPELEGMSLEEAQQYIMENAWDMKPTNDQYYDSLGEEVFQMDVAREKITGEESGIEFD
jgi:hypothetical protein